MSPASSLTTFVLVALRLSLLSSAALVSRDLHIQNAFLQPDGFNRSAVTADSRFPGPTISGNVGDQFLINVIDQLTDTTMHRATSIHWHGLFQARNAEMDGPAFVTQCPITPGNAFLYNFTAPGQSGTYWYHSHLSTQYCDGLRGPLILYDPNDPHKDRYDIDDDSTIITLADWYHGVSPSIFPSPIGGNPTPDATLINGAGRYAGAPTPAALAIVRGQIGKRHRFRIINTSCFPSYTFSIDGHNMTIIEADGVETEPLTVDQLSIYASQRYSVIVTMDKPADNYWIRAIPSTPAGSTTAGGLNSAILRYDGAPQNEPTTSASANPVIMNEADLHPLVNPGAPGQPFVGGVDETLQLKISKPSRWEINNASFTPPSVPVLLQILSGTQNANSLLPSGSVYNLLPNKTYEINIPGGGNHPFHLHGHNFDVVRVSGSSTYNYVNPVRRDTVSIGGGSDNVTFRFVTDNPGPWFLHCHIDWHLEGGLAVVFAEDTGDIASADPPNSAWDNLCPTYNANNPDTSITA